MRLFSVLMGSCRMMFGFFMFAMSMGMHSFVVMMRGSGMVACCGMMMLICGMIARHFILLGFPLTISRAPPNRLKRALFHQFLFQLRGR
jgi:hypothetical protein